MKNIFTLLIVSISIGIGLSSCQKDNLVTNVIHNVPTDPNWGKQAPDSLVSNFFFRGKIDGELVTFQDSLGGYYNLAYDSVYTICTDTNYDFYGQGFGIYKLNGKASLDVKLLRCIGDTSQAAGRDSVLYLGAYPYGSSSPIDPIMGVEVTWVDETGKIWQSLPGSGSKLNSSFEILNILPAPTDSIGSLVLYGSMNLHLFNATESIVIENGEFNLQYGIY